MGKMDLLKNGSENGPYFGPEIARGLGDWFVRQMFCPIQKLRGRKYKNELLGHGPVIWTHGPVLDR